MARIEDLVAEIDNKDLQAAFRQEVAQLKARMTFGLVFERHVPEVILLGPSVRVRIGDFVQLRKAPGDRRRFEVMAIDGKTATVAVDGAVEQVPLADLLLTKRFDQAIFPSLQSLGSVRRGGDRHPHLAIEGDNFHALQLLRFTHTRKFDCIYIDPPYNTGARDWKYNNDFVDSNDHYRHSKWLAFMEKRLKLAKELLKADGTLIVTIGEDELHHLAVLMERSDLFGDAQRQVVTACINPSGASGEGLSRVEEYAIFCFLGGRQPAPVVDNLLTGIGEADLFAEERPVELVEEKLTWESLLRRGNVWYRPKRPNLCYPVILSKTADRIVGVGGPWEPPQGKDGAEDESARPLQTKKGELLAWPVRKDGKLGIWRVNGERLMWLTKRGYAHVGERDDSRGTWALKYLLSGTVDQIESGEIEVTGKGARGQVTATVSPRRTAKTMWVRGRHTAGGAGGTQMLNTLLGERNVFSFPKSVYSTLDSLRIAVGEQPDALILDFFAGSATTLHATCLLNIEDDGRRRCVVVTNNEVSEERADDLNARGLFRGDGGYEKHGIFVAAARPRIEAAITGQRPDGERAEGTYVSGRPIGEGFEENVEFVQLDYLDPDEIEVRHDLGRLGPLVWLAAGARGAIIERLDDKPYGIFPDAGAAVLYDEVAVADFVAAITDQETVDRVFIFTDYDDSFASMTSMLSGRKTTMIPRDYLQWFRRHIGTPR